MFRNMWRPRAGEKLVSTVMKVHWWHLAANVAMVVAGGQYVGSKNLAGVFEFKVEKPLADALGKSWAQMTGICERLSVPCVPWFL